MEDISSTLKNNPSILISIGALILGIIMLFTGIVIGTTGTLRSSLGSATAYKIAGFIAGLSVSLLIGGVFAILPSTKSQKIGEGIGFSLSFVGVIMFLSFYPNNWVGGEPDYTLFVALSYATGILIMMGYLFLGVANLQTSEPSSQTHQKNSSGRRRPLRYSESEPQGTFELIKTIVKQKIGEEDVDSGQTELDINHIMELVEEDMEEDIIESIELDEDEEEIIIKRRQETPHAKFTTSIPPYVKITERDGIKYKLIFSDKDSLLITHPEMGS